MSKAPFVSAYFAIQDLAITLPQLNLEISCADPSISPFRSGAGPERICVHHFEVRLANAKINVPLRSVPGTVTKDQSEP